MRAPSGWMSYDGVADTYERVAVPWFTALAADLVHAADLGPREVVLDVGTGTGLAARAALESERTLRLVGLDPSAQMLARVPAHTLSSSIVGIAPGLPFARESFDAVLANLSLSHFSEHAAAIADIARVLRPHGRFACTAWSTPEPDGPDNQRGEADQVVGEVRAAHDLDLKPTHDAVPLEDWLKDPSHLQALLAGAGFDPVAITPHRSRWTFTIDEFLSGWGANGRYVRETAGESRWQRFVDDASKQLRARFGDHITIANAAWIAVATKPR